VRRPAPARVASQLVVLRALLVSPPMAHQDRRHAARRSFRSGGIRLLRHQPWQACPSPTSSPRWLGAVACIVSRSGAATCSTVWFDCGRYSLAGVRPARPRA